MTKYSFGTGHGKGLTEMKTMKVKVLPYNYIGHIVEHGLLFHTVRLASGALLIAPTYLIEVTE